MVRLHVVDRLTEALYKLRPQGRVASHTWPMTAKDLSRIIIAWPTIYQWPACDVIVHTIRDGFARYGVLRLAKTAQPHTGVIMLGGVVDGHAHKIALDYSDYHNFINESALAESSLYIKMQFRRGGYRDSRIVRGGYTVTGRDFYRYYIPFRQHGARRRLGVLGRFGYTFQGDIRRKAVSLLAAAADIDFVGSEGKVRYSRFLREAATARISLHMPGNGPFTHRVAEFLGLGTCMFSSRFATELHIPLQPGVHYVEFSHDLSDLVETVRYYLRHDEERESIARAGQAFFDRYLHCDQLVAYYLQTILERLACPDSE